MFSLIQKVLHAARLFDAACERINQLEANIVEIEKKLERFEKLADENESLWEFLDNQPEEGPLWDATAEDFQDEIANIMIRNMEPAGDA